MSRSSNEGMVFLFLSMISLSGLAINNKLSSSPNNTVQQAGQETACWRCGQKETDQNPPISVSQGVAFQWSGCWACFTSQTKR